jgi:hypothetical protein
MFVMEYVNKKTAYLNSVKYMVSIGDYMKYLLLICCLCLLLLTGCSTSTSIILKVQNQQFDVIGFGRGQSIGYMQCITCTPQAKASVYITNMSGQEICKGNNSINSLNVENPVFRISCPGLEAYDTQTVKIHVEGVISTDSKPVTVKLDKEVVVNFEKK